MTLQSAEKVAAAAEAEARRRNATVVIAVVDDGGYPIIVKRLDDTQVASVDVGIAKARTAAMDTLFSVALCKLPIRHAGRFRRRRI
jgi:uncharacterized protein GlcG (DUF336 family)